MADFDDMFDDFSVDMGDFEVKRVQKFDRMWRIGEGGSVSTGVTLHENLIYFASANFNIYCVNPENGDLVWRFKTEGVIAAGIPKIADGIVYSGSYDRSMYALNAKTGELIWKFTAGDKIGSAAALSDDKVYFGCKDQNVYALDGKTGELIWKFRTYDCIMSEPLVVGKRLFIGSYDRNFYCIDKETGNLLWKIETQAEVHNDNVFLHKDGVVYFGSFDSYLRAADVESGTLLWKTKLGNYGIGTGAVECGDMILQSTRDGILYALDAEGKVLWKFSTREEDVLGVPCIHDGKIIVGSCGDYHLHCVDFEGNKLWSFRALQFLYERSVLVENMLIFPSWDCHVYSIDINSQRVVWKFKADGSPAYVPPPHEAFEFQTTVSSGEVEEVTRKTYEFELTEGDQNTSEYKSDITYQGGTTYREKGKYQIDSKEEAF